MPRIGVLIKAPTKHIKRGAYRSVRLNWPMRSRMHIYVERAKAKTDVEYLCPVWISRGNILFEMYKYKTFPLITEWCKLYHSFAAGEEMAVEE